MESNSSLNYDGAFFSILFLLTKYTLLLFCIQLFRSVMHNSQTFPSNFEMFSFWNIFIDEKKNLGYRPIPIGETLNCF